MSFNFFGHTKIESTLRYLGIDVDDALAISEQVEIEHADLRAERRLCPSLICPLFQTLLGDQQTFAR